MIGIWDSELCPAFFESLPIEGLNIKLAVLAQGRIKPLSQEEGGHAYETKTEPRAIMTCMTQALKAQWLWPHTSRRLLSAVFADERTTYGNIDAT
ncbi:hypothetical protein EVAR_30024_1 [Eumeta japonica]|uniref:Uncharacterized protein n=1 Tax=Eumeta variegata TaxID=151549 RepID=A0A4C1VUH9_EUMVA|nr:hypothetical protein EVAR_30024_1 [Eumeta japonica]